VQRAPRSPQFKAADEILDPILRATPDYFMASYLRASELIKQQQYAAADEILGRVSAKFPLFPAGYYLQGKTKFALDQFAQAEFALAKYLGYVPNDRRAVWLIAIAALRQHGAPRAIEYIKLFFNRVSADAATLTLLGNAYLADRKPALALQQFQAAAALDPENPNIKTGVALSEIDTGQTEQGLAQLEQLFASETGAAVAGPTLVLTELKAGRVGKAAETAASLVHRNPDNPLYLTLLGEVRAALHDDLGRKRRSTTLWRKIRALLQQRVTWHSFTWQPDVPMTPGSSTPGFCRRIRTTRQTPRQKRRKTPAPFSGWPISRVRKRNGLKRSSTSTMRAPSPRMIRHPVSTSSSFMNCVRIGPALGPSRSSSASNSRNMQCRRGAGSSPARSRGQKRCAGQLQTRPAARAELDPDPFAVCRTAPPSGIFSRRARRAARCGSAKSAKRVHQGRFDQGRS